MHWWDYGWSMGLWGWFLMVLIWVLVILGIVLLVRSALGTGKKIERETALTLLEKRYARGEISREEFERTRSDLIKD
ncbi:MAG: SHOCT domain-containing protein [Alphaproteobacteria bacterium]|uniref:SHOCT domain-containing protein n=1 Tax=Candidatus Nitrobium versatile TaxID=2884831 RepID=A0A953JBR6_9BACT|nr:SHOCT domain-containing protein [Candidatus Nitrobium versatile]